jgi:hypothetical protein
VDDIIQQLAERTGLPIDQAGKALEGLLSILKERLPGGLGEQVAALLSGQGGDNPLAGLVGGLGDMLGGDKPESQA